MSKRSQKSVKAAGAMTGGYGPLLADIKARVKAAQVKAGLAAIRRAELFHGVSRQAGTRDGPVED